VFPIQEQASFFVCFASNENIVETAIEWCSADVKACGPFRDHYDWFTSKFCSRAHVIGGDVNARIRDTKATRVVMLIAHDGFAEEAGKAKDRTSLLKVVRKPTLS
jgi:hypothetical protein